MPEPSHQACQAIKQGTLKLPGTVKSHLTEERISITTPLAFQGADFQHDIPSRRYSVSGTPLNSFRCHQVTVKLQKPVLKKTTFLLIPEYCTWSNQSMPSEGTSRPAFCVEIQRSNHFESLLRIGIDFFLVGVHPTASAWFHKFY